MPLFSFPFIQYGYVYIIYDKKGKYITIRITKMESNITD